VCGSCLASWRSCLHTCWRLRHFFAGGISSRRVLLRDHLPFLLPSYSSVSAVASHRSAPRIAFIFFSATSLLPLFSCTGSNIRLGSYNIFLPSRRPSCLLPSLFLCPFCCDDSSAWRTVYLAVHARRLLLAKPYVRRMPAQDIFAWMPSACCMPSALGSAPCPTTFYYLSALQVLLPAPYCCARGMPARFMPRRWRMRSDSGFAASGRRETWRYHIAGLRCWRTTAFSSTGCRAVSGALFWRT